tara:strand:+ start:194 stop:403 length:210 start_codon:yes stop_codon:yes gene_type:complete
LVIHQLGPVVALEVRVDLQKQVVPTILTEVVDYDILLLALKRITPAEVEEDHIMLVLVVVAQAAEVMEI